MNNFLLLNKSNWRSFFANNLFTQSREQINKSLPYFFRSDLPMNRKQTKYQQDCSYQGKALNVPIAF